LAKLGKHGLNRGKILEIALENHIIVIGLRAPGAKRLQLNKAYRRRGFHRLYAIIECGPIITARMRLWGFNNPDFMDPL
jgi:hypothetical protein